MMGDDPDKQNVTSVDVDVHEVFQRKFLIGFIECKNQKNVKNVVYFFPLQHYFFLRI